MSIQPALNISFSRSGSMVLFGLFNTAQVVRLPFTSPQVQADPFACPACYPGCFLENESGIVFGRWMPFAGGFTGTEIVTYSTPGGERVQGFPSALYGTNQAKVEDLLVTPNGESFLCVVSGSGLQVRTYSTRTGEAQLKSQLMDDFADTISVSYASKRIAAGTFDRGSILIWNLEDLSLVTRLTNHLGSSSFAAISKDGNTLYSGARDGTLRRYSCDDWSEQLRVDTSQKGVREIGVDSEETIVVTRGYDGTVKGWTAKDFRPLFKVQVSNPVPEYDRQQNYRVRISPDGSVFATAGSDGIGKLFSIPLHVTRAERNDQSVLLEWAGGHPPFKLQSRGSITSGDWEDVPGTMTSRRLRVPVSGSRFYRVVASGPSIDGP
jgi:WD40 repeat protein